LKKDNIIVITFFVLIIAAWQLTAQAGVFPKLLFPSVAEIGKALTDGVTKENMLLSAAYSLSLILKGMGLGIVLTLILTTLSILFKPVQAIFNALIAIFDPLPGIAMIPLAMIWFGTGELTIMFLMVHGMLWPMSRNVLDGVKSIPRIYVEVGENIGLKGIGMVTGIYMPACFPYILSGLKTGWARAWRALISVEMIFGMTEGIGGIGFYIFTRRYQLDMAGVFASLIVIILIGLAVEYGIFAQVERRTIRRWGMVR
jgi:NitT/TauT family transport system permease protein